MARGGKRKGAGRKAGAPTQVLRVPADMVDSIRQFVSSRGFRIPRYSSHVQAGTPTAADDHIEEYLDLNAYLLREPSRMIAVPVAGESMVGAGIHAGDLLLVDTGAVARSGQIVVASVDGQSTVKYLELDADKAWLVPANPAFDAIPLTPECDVSITGVVVHCIKSFP